MLETRTLVLGFQGENLRTQLRIDCASTFAEYPNATPALAIKPPSGETYPVFVERDGTEVVWDIVANNLILKGDGELQLTFYKDNVIAKTSVGHITVNRSLQIDGEMPDVVATWIENANRKLAEVDAQIVELEGMVDTATDAATHAEQSASTASTKAEQAAGSAATATAKATEATNAAGTATAKAAEAEQSALTASTKASDAAESERISTLKATEANQFAQTASTKAFEAAESQRISEEKAQSAITAESNAQDAKDIALRAKQDALAAQTAAEAAKTAAETSATQAAQSVQDAGANAQTAMQKATEASQSATNAEASATNASTSAETASTKAGEAAQSAQAVEETAEQLAESLEQIAQNTQDIAELDERKANIDGYYPDMTVGNAEQLNSSKYVENSEPYTLRTSGGTSDIGNREYLDAVVGGTLAWNQMVRDEASENSTDFAPIVTVTDSVEDAAGVKVKIEPVQDLHGYDHPWPAGGGKNLLPKGGTSNTYQGVTVSYDSENEIYTLNGTVNSVATIYLAFPRVESMTLSPDKTYSISCKVVSGSFVLGDDSSTNNTYSVACFSKNLSNYFRGGLSLPESALDGYSGYGRGFETESYYCVLVQCWKVGTVFNNLKIKIQIEEGQTATAWRPYANICPITGWDGVQVSRTGKNLFDLTNAIVKKWRNYAGGFKAVSDSATAVQYSKNNDSLTITTYSTYYGVCFEITSAPVARTFSISNPVSMITLYESYVDGSPVLAQGTSTSCTIPANTSGVIALRVDSETTVTTSIQLENGTATDYEPYAGNTYDITLPTEAGTVYGGELTVNADGSGSLVVDRASVDMGELSWMFMNVNGTQRLCSVSLNPLPLTPRSDYYPPEIICSAYKVVYVSQLPNNLYSISMGFSGYGYGNRLIVNDETITTVEQATEKLSGQTCVYKLLTPLTYTLTASQIRTLLGTNNVWADTGDLALTYTGTDEHLVLESGKKYLARISGTDSMLLGSGQEITAAKGADNVFDLTQMFGTAVADYVYGQGAGFFRKWFGKTWYPYNSGELLSVEGLQSHDMVGFNAWDEEWEIRGSASYRRLGSKNKIPVIPGAQYFFNAPVNPAYGITYYKSDGVTRTGTIWYNKGIITMPSDAFYMMFDMDSTYGFVYKHDICISLAHNGSRNGEYEPYEKHSYPLDSTVILRGIPKVGANGVYWDGDTYEPDGTVTRKFKQIVLDGVNNLFTASWGASDNGYAVYKTISDIDPNGRPLILCDRFENANLGQTNMPPWTVGGNSGAATTVTFKFPSTITSTAGANNWLKDNNVTMIYPVAEPTIEQAQPYHSTQWVSDWGTEEFVSTGIVPVGTETRYPANLRDKLQHLPDAASGNGSYLITQTDGQMVLTSFPAPPSTAGNYVLKATVTNGVATYTWEVAT